MNTVNGRFHQSDILTKLGHFLLLKRKLFYSPVTKHLNVSIYFLKNILKSHSFQETKASITVSSETNRANKINLNIFGVDKCRQNLEVTWPSTHKKTVREQPL